jgi:hypothetical protein
MPTPLLHYGTKARIYVKPQNGTTTTTADLKRSADKREQKSVLRIRIRDPDPGSGALLTPGSGINIPDPQHWQKNLLDQNIERYLRTCLTAPAPAWREHSAAPCAAARFLSSGPSVGPPKRKGTDF